MFRLFAAAFCFLFLIVGGAPGQEPPINGANLNSDVVQQIANRLEEKKNRSTSALAKVNAQLTAESQKLRGGSGAIGRQAAVAEMPDERFVINDNGAVGVDIQATVTKQLIKQITAGGGEIIFVSIKDNFVQAYLLPSEIERIAAFAEVTSITPAFRGKTNNLPVAPEQLFRSAFAPQPFVQLNAVGSAGSEGDITHRAAQARAQFNVSGAGVKVGVLSDSVRFLERSQATGDLPANVTVIPGQSGIVANGRDSGEGTAMLEIVHDLAPDAQLYFATGLSNNLQNPVVFANNIRALRDAGCQIIIDDLVATYGPDGTPFQDVIIGAAINDVTASGVLYFSAAGNFGDLDDGTSGVWEGDFGDSGIPLNDQNGNPVATFHDFGNGAISNVITVSNNFAAFLWWSDAVGRSANDYDLFLLNAEGTQIIADSTGLQNGNRIPFEFVFLPENAAGTQLVVTRRLGSQTRGIHLSVDGGRLGNGTAGQIRGHNGAANALSIAATPGGIYSFNVGPFSPFPNPFNSSNEVERFSSDGFRRIFYNQNGQPLTRFGSFVFAGFGGRTLFKPEFTAADGVTTSFPLFASGLNPFFGTSAAAPHAGAIAALAKSANPSANRQQLINFLRAGAIDIEAPFLDRDSGNGIIDALGAVQAARAAGSGSSSGSCSSTVSGGVCTITRCLNGSCTTQSFPLPAGGVCACSSGSRTGGNDKQF